MFAVTSASAYAKGGEGIERDNRKMHRQSSLSCSLSFFLSLSFFRCFLPLSLPLPHYLCRLFASLSLSLFLSLSLSLSPFQFIIARSGRISAQKFPRCGAEPLQPPETRRTERPKNHRPIHLYKMEEASLMQRPLGQRSYLFLSG